MAIVIQEALDSDIPRAAETEAAAYGGGSSIFFPGTSDPGAGIKARAKQIIEMRKNDPTARLLIVVDEETGEQISFAKYHIYETSEAVAASSGRPLPSGPGVNEEACKAFFGGLILRKKEVMGLKPHIYLHMLHTDPKHSRRGAASALLKWGAERADQLGLPTYLESSNAAHDLYGRHGFKDVEVFEVDMRPYGGDKTFTAPLMIREPMRPTAGEA